MGVDSDETTGSYLREYFPYIRKLYPSGIEPNKKGALRNIKGELEMNWSP